MDNQIVEYIQELVPNGPTNLALQIYNQLTPEQRQQLVQYIREGTQAAYQGATSLLSQARAAMGERMRGRVNEFGREFGQPIGSTAHPNLPSQGTMINEDSRAAPPGAPAATRIAAEATKTAGSNGTMMGVGHGETPIDPVRSIIRQPWQSSVTTVHHYYAAHGPSQVTTTAPAVWRYRLNSIYDCRDTGTYVDTDPPATPVADGADAAVNTPTWRTYWSTYYNYWTVLSSKYRMRFKLAPTDATTKDVELMCYVYHHGTQFPPLYADATAGGTGTTLVAHQFRRQHRGMYYFPLRYRPDTGFNNQEQFDINSCSGEWVPGSIKHEVAEDELQQIWHKITEVPPTREGLTFIIQRSPVGNYTGAVDIYPEISIEYTVQWKDLKRAYQYPTQITSVPAINNAGDWAP